MPSLETLPRLVLEYARLEVGSGERHAQYEALADRFGDGRVIGEIEAQQGFGRVEFGSSPRGCWLTEHGASDLASQLVQERV